MSKIRSIAIILGVILLLLPSAAKAQATPTKIKLLTQNTGWALMHGRLFWTTDFGQDWRDITPSGVAPRGPATIADVFFLDTSSGWALLRHYGSKTRGWKLEVVSTNDGGASWSLPVSLPQHWGCLTCSISGSGSIDFVDAAHGWIDLAVESVAPSRPGVLLATSDGGKTWNFQPKGLSIAGRLRFVTAEVGWAAGGPVDSELCVTRDGGRTWQRITPVPPREVGVPVTIETSSLKRVPSGSRAVLPAYDLPVFRDPLHGYLPVSYAGWQPGAPRGPEKLVVFATADGGRTWASDVVLVTGEESTAGVRVPNGLADSTLVVRLAPAGGGLHMARVSLGGARGTVPSVTPTASGGPGLSFVDAERGWVIAGGLILSTSDGGATWGNITPKMSPGSPTKALPRRAPQAVGQEDQPSPATAGNEGALQAPATGGGKAVGSLHTSPHLGFDKLGVPSAGEMHTWWQYSPYYDVGIYLPNARVSDSNVSPTWVSDVVGYGWGLIPIWDGLQAPCACKDQKTSYPSCQTPFGANEVFSTSPSTAYSQGRSQAQAAEAGASAIGLSKTVVYADVENYNSSYMFGQYTCGEIVANYAEGWDDELRNDGYTSGIYASASDATDFWSADPGPTDAWFAKDDGRATIWGLGYGILDQGMWGEGFRAHQYVGDNPEEYGDQTPYSIDRDIEYAQVDGGSGFKTYSYCSTCFSDYPDLGGLTFGGFTGINDGGMGQPNSGAWEAVGWTYNGSNVEVIDDVGGTVANPWYVDYGSFAGGINNLRQLVGGAHTTPGDCIAGGTEEGLYSQPTGQGISLLKYADGPPAPDYGCGQTVFTDINDDGKVTAYFRLEDVTKGTTTWTGFTWDSSTGTVGPALAHSGWSDILPLGINGFGQIVGQYQDSRGNNHAFIEDNGVYTTISACKGSTTTDVWAINNNEQVVGICGSTEFMYDLKNKKITTVYDPSAGSQPTNCSTLGRDDALVDSCALKINDAAQIAGLVTPAAQYQLWGFIATPTSTTQ